MAEETKDTPEIDTGAETGADDAMFDDVDAVADLPPEQPTRARLPTVFAFGALVASLTALAGVAWLAFTAPEAEPVASGDDPAVAAVRSAVDANNAALAALQRRLDAAESELRSADSGTPVDIEAFERRLEQRLRSAESMAPRVASLESAVSGLRGISTGARDAWLLAEAAYYMQIANAQLQLAGNPELAELALRIADERIVELGDPGLTDVRRALSNELRSLEVIEAPDVAGATLILASLSRVVDSLPVRQEIVTGDGEADPAVDEGELTGTDRALSSLRNAMSGAFSIRRVDEAARPLISPEAIYFLRANLALQLQSARLALLRGEQTLFQQSLDDASAWLREYYDTESEPVRGALQTIGEIRESSFSRALPDISESLRLLRQYMAFQEATNAPAASELPEDGNEPAATDIEPPQ